ncbi:MULTISPECIES: ABC transporter ATP-binding protein [unclassified Chryseobacterium]|uniref:ABC transporter ATP-binding protein n=1 Tax=unclassified Chryseobacterium TaxID=2593645 RepID=UPI0011575998|nr:MULTISPECIES: ABC transporter ATP-binding protein [unclassified Chryseobacterium]MBO9692910.1 ABC transporter ATP-binding protein [Chryseobacterium sp.]GEJ46801.1 ABC transporter ATP-binding protein [Chryseobacterium sp. ON_d1]
MLALKAENISKQYRLGQVGTGTLSHDLNRFWHKVRGKEDPYLKIGEANDRATKGDSEYVWSLQDINFEIQQGDAVGIIGRNGAGKSTLLKLLSKVTKPTTGKIYSQGRIASLLEVGTGFHPEMTGRENVFLNGAILGMTRKEITRKFDEIVDFSGVERYIDTPVKRYSSGMYVRLAFAVAAHLESEILIVDEVLAVGDAEFQKKCLGKMGDVTKGEGRTILFVSHNITAIKELCNYGILLDKGTLVTQGDINKCIIEYQKNNDIKFFYDYSNDNTKVENHKILVKSYKAEPINGDMINIKSGIKVTVTFMSKLENVDIDLSFFLKNSHDLTVMSTGIMVSQNKNSEKGDYTVSFEIPPYTINEDSYHFDFFWGVNRSDIAFRTELFGFEVHGMQNQFGEIIKSPGILFPRITHTVERA